MNSTNKLIKTEALQTSLGDEAIRLRLPRRPKGIGLLAMTRINSLIIITLFCVSTAFSQDRSTINNGVDKYEKNDFTGATENFQKSIDEKFENYEGHFNLGDALYKQGKYEDALKSYKNALSLAQTDEQKAEIYHNVGNSLLKSQKLEESIGAYTESLKLNPDDLDTKYNLSYALKQMQQQQKDQDKKQDKNDKNKDDKKDQDKNKDENQDKQDKDKDKKEDQNKDQDKKDDQQNQDQKNDKQDDQQNQEKQPPPEISKEEAQRILNALKDDEKDLQKELRKKKGKAVKVEKDW